jgi:hypothetical protein
MSKLSGIQAGHLLHPEDRTHAQMLEDTLNHIKNRIGGSFNFDGDESITRDDTRLALAVLLDEVHGLELIIDVDELAGRTAVRMRERAATEIEELESDLLDGGIDPDIASKSLIKSLGFLSIAHSTDRGEEEIDLAALSVLDDEVLEALAKRQRRTRNFRNEDLIRSLIDQENADEEEVEDGGFEHLSSLTFDAQMKLAMRAERRLNYPKAIALREFILEKPNLPIRERVESYTFLIRDLERSGNVSEAQSRAENFWDYLNEISDAEPEFRKRFNVVSRQVTLYSSLCKFEDKLGDKKEDNWRDEREGILEEFLDDEEISDPDRYICYKNLFDNIEDTTSATGLPAAMKYCKAILSLSGLSIRNGGYWAKKKEICSIHHIIAEEGVTYKTDQLVDFAKLALKYDMSDEAVQVLMIAKARPDLTEAPADARDVYEMLIAIHGRRGKLGIAASFADTLSETQLHGFASGDSQNTLVRANHLRKVQERLAESWKAAMLSLLDRIDGEIYEIGGSANGSVKVKNSKDKRSLTGRMRSLIGEAPVLFSDELSAEIDKFFSNLSEGGVVEYQNLRDMKLQLESQF